MNEMSIPRSMVRQLLGASRFDSLAPSLQRIHAREGRHRYSGEVDVVRGRGLLARLCAWATCLPAQGHGTMHVEIFANHHGEQWTRRYCGRSMRSRLWAKNGLLYERLGLVTFVFRLEAEDHAITWHVQRVHALGVPLPVRWFSQVHAREYEQDGRYRYEVNAALPLTGMLVRYRGSLDVG